jgi:hypothetical protein
LRRVRGSPFGHQDSGRESGSAGSGRGGNLWRVGGQSEIVTATHHHRNRRPSPEHCHTDWTIHSFRTHRYSCLQNTWPTYSLLSCCRPRCPSDKKVKNGQISYSLLSNIGHGGFPNRKSDTETYSPVLRCCGYRRISDEAPQERASWSSYSGPGGGLLFSSMAAHTDFRLGCGSHRFPDEAI